MSVINYSNINFLIFSTQQAASIAVQQINSAISFTKGSVTTTWDVPQKRSDGMWVIQAPKSQFIKSVQNFTTAPYDPTWFPPISMPTIGNKTTGVATAVKT